MNLMLLVGRQLGELAHRHPAADCQHGGVPLITTKPPEPLALPLIGQAIDANAFDLDLGDWGSG
jgi:hypothetical protein